MLADTVRSINQVQLTVKILTVSRNWWSTDTGILCGHREVSAHTFPIGIEPSEFHRRLEKSCVQESLRKMRHGFRGTKVILGVDRLDCIKGIPQKLHAFDELLEQYPELIGNVILLQVAIPSRDHLKAHQDLKEEIQQLVGRINGKHGMFLAWLSIITVWVSLDGRMLTLAQARSTTCLSSSCTPSSNRTSSQPCTLPPTSV
jgi:trehalose 6-phosphate synthase